MSSASIHTSWAKKAFRLSPPILLFSTLLLLAFDSAAAQTVTAPPSSSVSEDQDFAFAYGLFSDGLFQHAREQFVAFARKYPSSLRRIDSEFLAVECLYRLQHYEEAVREFERFARDYPASSLTDDAQFRVGEALLKLGRIPASIDAFKIVLDQSAGRIPFSDALSSTQRVPKRELAGEAAYWIGEGYVRLEDYDNALKYYTLAYEGYPANRLRDYAVYSVAWTYQRKKEYDRAVVWYERLMREIPQSALVAGARVRIGECYYFVGDYKRAIEYLTDARPALVGSSELAEAEYLIAESLYHLSRYAEAQRQYEAFLAAHADHPLRREVTYALGWSLMKQENFRQAAEVFGWLTDGSDPLAHAGLYRQGEAQRLMGDRQSALRTFEAVVARWPRGEFADNALFDAGMIRFENKDIAGAKRDFEAVVRDHPQSDVLPDAYRMAGECYLAEGDFERAYQMFERALAQPNAPAEVRVNSLHHSAWSLFKLKRFAEAAEKFGLLRTEFPQHPRALEAAFWQGEAYYQAGNYRQAIASYGAVAAVASHERKEEAMYGIGWSYYRLNDFTRAREAFERLIAAFPNGKFAFDARVRVGDTYFFAKDYQRAAGAYRSVVRQYGQRDGVDYAYYQLGQSHFRAGEYDLASQQFAAVVRAFPASALADDAQYALGWVKFQRKEYLEAIKEFQKVAANYPSSDLVPRALYSIGDSYYNLQQYAAAEKAYREILDRFPNSPYVSDALSGIQYCLVAQGKQDDALNVIDAFIRQNPDAGIVEELELRKADLLYSQKRYAEAIRQYQSFVSRYPRSRLVGTAHFWTGKSLQAQDRLQEAAMTLERAAATAGIPPRLAATALIDAGTIYLQQRQYDRALGVFEKVEREFSDTEVAPEASLLKGVVFYENGDLREARNQFEFIISKDPSSEASFKARLQLARISHQQRDFPRTLQLAHEVATSRNDELGAEAQFLVATVHADQGSWQEAVTAYLRVRYVYPAFEIWVTRAYLGLGIAYENLKDLRRAREAYQQVVRMKKDDQAVAEAERRLKSLERM